jgi:hypothetical protein
MKKPVLHLARVPSDPKKLREFCEKLARDLKRKATNEESPDRLE